MPLNVIISFIKDYKINQGGTSYWEKYSSNEIEMQSC